jgi:hypothetical protein
VGDAQTVTLLNLTGAVGWPAPGSEAPSAVDTVQYEGALSWRVIDGAPHAGAFAPDTAYQADIDLTAKSGFVFAGIPRDVFYYTGAGVRHRERRGSSMSITITFPPSATAAAAAVDHEDFGTGVGACETSRINVPEDMDWDRALSRIAEGPDWRYWVVTVNAPAEGAAHRGFGAKNVKVSLRGASVVTLQSGAAGSLLVIGQSGCEQHVILRGPTLRSAGSNTAPLVAVTNTGTLTIRSGSIEDNTTGQPPAVP